MIQYKVVASRKCGSPVCIHTWFAAWDSQPPLFLTRLHFFLLSTFRRTELNHFGHDQPAMVFSQQGFGLTFQGASGIFETRQEMLDYINTFVKCTLEQVALPLTGNMLGLMIGESTVASSFAPIEKMKTALLADFNREHEERHLLAFLHEFDSTLDDEINYYREKRTRYLRSNQRQVYDEGKPLMPVEDEPGYLEDINELLSSLNQKEVTLTYATGPIGEYFQDFVQRCYRRATQMLELSKQYDGTNYKNFTIEEFRQMAEVLTHEAQGLLVENIASPAISVTLNGESYSLTKGRSPVPLHYAALRDVTLSGSRSTVTDDAAVIINYGLKAFIANISSGQSKIRKVVRRGIERDGIIYPNTTRFSGTEVNKRIQFEELSKPTARNVEDRNLRNGVTDRLVFSRLFDVPSVGNVSYRITPPLNEDIIEVTRLPGENHASIKATGIGTTQVVVTAENEAGPTEVTVTVNVR